MYKKCSAVSTMTIDLHRYQKPIVEPIPSICRHSLRPRDFPRRLAIMVVPISGRIAPSQLIRRPTENDDPTLSYQHSISAA